MNLNKMDTKQKKRFLQTAINEGMEAAKKKHGSYQYKEDGKIVDVNIETDTVFIIPDNQRD